MNMNIMAQLSLILPELLVSIGAIVLLMFGAFSKERSYAAIMGLAIAILFSAIILLCLFSKKGEAFGGALNIDSFSNGIKGLILLGTIASLVMSVGFATAEKFDKFEFPVLCLFSVVGMMLMVSAGNMLTLYLGLELQSLSLYTLAAFNRDNAKSSEAGLKYFVLGSLSSGMLLYGISLLYGFTGCIDFYGIANSLMGHPAEIGVIVAIVFVFAGLAFKISAVPFHMWTPDVYEGAPTPITAFFASAPKIAALAMILRVVMDAFLPLPGVQGAMPAWQQIIVFMAMASMALSAFAGIGQKNIKRLFAYSSIGHIGYALVGLAAGDKLGIIGVIIYMIIYLISTIGCFAFILAMRNRDGNSEDIYDLSGLAHSNPFMAIMMTIQLFSLAGIPPLSGFFAKWYSFSAAVNSGLAPLAVFGMIASVIASFYYLRLIKIMWFDEAKTSFIALAPELKIMLGFSGAFTLFYLFFGRQILIFAERTALSFF